MVQTVSRRALRPHFVFSTVIQFTVETGGEAYVMTSGFPAINRERDAA